MTTLKLTKKRDNVEHVLILVSCGQVMRFIEHFVSIRCAQNNFVSDKLNLILSFLHISCILPGNVAHWVEYASIIL